ncbi:HEPN domain-containing protein [Candidatus Dependentiae bacterium]|jgi:HEPN domain-containing protein|nr:HEPN domain-containing protein [Candidatus Dependentiae bacterium]
MPGVKDWLKKASSDLKASKKLLDDDETLDCSVYHTHQSAEKTFKAFIIFTKQPIPKTHDLGLLLEYCVRVNPEFMILLKESRELNPYCHDSRYPSDTFYVDREIAQHATEMAENVFLVVKNKIIN